MHILELKNEVNDLLIHDGLAPRYGQKQYRSKVNNPSLLVIFHNVTLLLSIALLFDVFVGRGFYHKSIVRKFIFGFLLGGAGIILMLSPWQYAPGIFFDSRSILIGISGLFFGAIPTIIAMIMTSAFRFYQGGIAAWTGVIVIMTTGTIGIIWRHFLNKPMYKIAGWQIYLFGFVIHLDMLICIFVLPLDSAKLVLTNITFPILLIYPLGTFLLGLLMVNRLRREQAAENLLRTEARMRILVKILQFPVESIKEFLDFSLSQALELTESSLGCVFTYSEDQQGFVLNSALPKERVGSSIINSSTTYNLEEIGFWGEGVVHHKDVIENNHASKSQSNEYFPFSQCDISNYLSIPVFQNEKVIAVIGLANKKGDYKETDLLELSILINGVLKIVQRKNAEEELQIREEFFRALFEKSPTGYTITSLEGNYLKVNKTFESILGYSTEEIIGRNWADFTLSDDIRFNQEIMQPLFSGVQNTIEFEKRYLHRDGNLVTVLINTTLLRNSQNVPQFFITNILDITNRKKIEEELYTTQKELQQMLVESEQSHAALLSVIEDQKKAEENIAKLNLELEQRVKDRTSQLVNTNKELEAFTFSVSHDLRAPLRALDGYSVALLEDYSSQLDDQGKAFIAHIREASKKMAQLIDDLLFLSRVTRSEIHLEKVNLSAMANEILSDLLSQEPERLIEIDVTPGMFVKADPKLLGIALGNLISNAVKFTNKQKKGFIQIGCVEITGEEVFFVRDNGAGFNMKFVDKLFNPFQRLHQPQEFPGTGIGLVTVQRIITRHGGRIWPDAKVGQGAIFYFTLAPVVLDDSKMKDNKYIKNITVF
jgi:PAS domain S-box-containing protein